MIFRHPRQCLVKLCLVMACCLPVTHAFASDGGGGAAGNAAIKFIANLGSNKYLQFEMVLEAAKPEAQHALNLLKPKLQHEIILLLSQVNFDSLITLKGKLELQELIKEVANKLIDETPKTGVKEVLFTSFLIQ